MLRTSIIQSLLDGRVKHADFGVAERTVNCVITAGRAYCKSSLPIPSVSDLWMLSIDNKLVNPLQYNQLHVPHTTRAKM